MSSTDEAEPETVQREPAPGIGMSMLRSLALSGRKAGLAIGLGLAGTALCVAVTPGHQWFPGALLSLVLAWAAIVDADRKILPNAITLGLIATGLVRAFSDSENAFWIALIGAAAGYVTLSIVGWLYLRSRRRAGLGQGDAKLLGAAGAWLGSAPLPMVMLLASAAALLKLMIDALAGKPVQASTKLAFGPYIAAAVWSIWLARGCGILSVDL